ncbi:MAG: ABC transporter substrate-binding protein [Comamonadaceae bacterium]|nr:ABC transporter substrate-binding protein [Comamonadaceae bacterium]
MALPLRRARRRCGWRRWSTCWPTTARVRRVYLIDQDYSFGREVAAERATHDRRAAAGRADRRRRTAPDGPRPRLRAVRRRRSRRAGRDTVVTGNWGNDLTLLVRALREAGSTANFYTFYGNGLGAAGGDRRRRRRPVRAVAEWHPNAGAPESMERVYADVPPRFSGRRGTTISRRVCGRLVEMLVRAIAGAHDRAAWPTGTRARGRACATAPADGNPLGAVTMRRDATTS